MPNLETYDGSANPLDHLSTFKPQLRLNGATDEIMCHALASVLKGPARSWYNSLPPHSIHSFEQFSTLMLTHFISSRRRRTPTSTLKWIKQGDDESLWDYLKRFQQVVVKIDFLDLTLAKAYFKEGLKSELALWDITKQDRDDQLSYVELMTKAEQYAIAEAEVRTKRNKGVISTNDAKTKTGEDKGGSAKDRAPHKFRNGKRFKPAFGFSNIDNIMQVEQS